MEFAWLNLNPAKHSKSKFKYCFSDRSLYNARIHYKKSAMPGEGTYSYMKGLRLYTMCIVHTGRIVDNNSQIFIWHRPESLNLSVQPKSSGQQSKSLALAVFNNVQWSK